MQACKAWRAWVGNSEEHPLVATLVSGLIVSQGSSPHHVHVTYTHARIYTRTASSSPRGTCFSSSRLVLLAPYSAPSQSASVPLPIALTLSLTSLARRRRTTLSGYVVGTVGPVFALCEREEGRVQAETRRGLSCLSLSRLVSPLTLWLLWTHICVRRGLWTHTLTDCFIKCTRGKSCSEMDTCTYLLTAAINKIFLVWTNL